MKRRKIIKLCCATVLTSGISWMLYQVKTTKQILYEAFDANILNLLEPNDKDVFITKQIIPKSEYMEIKSLDDEKPYNIWHSFKFLFSQRLISLCRDENKFVRLKALSSLAKVKLDDWHCTLLANMIDEGTAVQLARIKNTDSRLFLKPPLRYLHYDHTMLVNEIRDLLVNLYEKSKHPCLEYIISKIFFDVHDTSRIIDNDSIPVELSRLIRSGADIIPYCLESLLHHASIEHFSKDIVDLNALPLLVELHNRFKNNINVNITLCRIISYLSFHPEILEELHKTGWIGILSEWVKHEDVRLSIPATRALVNLNAKEERYQRHLYQLHPTYIDAKEPKVDVVFIHGLLGGVFFTWRQRLNTEISLGLIETLTQTLSSRNAPKKYHKKIKCSDPDTMQYIANLEEEAKTELSDFEVVLDDIPVNGNCTSNCGYTCKSEKLATCEDDDCYTYCWPRDWLPEDCDNLRVIGINYDTTLSKWNSFCPNMSGKTDLEEQSEKLLLYLQQAGLGKRPIVWITHSMGGLIAKNILCKAFASTDPNIRQICTNTKALVFYSTPHMGSSLATLNQASQLVLWPSIEVNNLRENSPLLLNLHENFLNLLRDVPIKIISFVETRKTVFTALKFNFQLVTPESGNTGIGEYYQIPLDHLEICKPISKFSFLYRKIVDLIQEVEDAV